MNKRTGKADKPRERLASATAVVLDHGEKPIGAAFLIDPNTLITCAHVVSAALGRTDTAMPDERVRVRFPVHTPAPDQDARVIGWQPAEEPGTDAGGRRGDIAVLRLTTAQDHIRPLRLAQRRTKAPYPCAAFGFPNHDGTGAWFHGSVRGQASDERMEVIADEGAGYPIQGGFSGAAVLSDRKKSIVGMVVDYQTEPGLGIGYMIPAHALRAAIRLVGPRHRSPQESGRVRWRVPGWMKRPGALLTGAGLLVLLAVSGVVVPILTGHTACGMPAQVRVAVSPGEYGLYEGVARDYEDWVAQRHGGCRAVDMFVYPVAADPAAPGGTTVPGQADPVHLDGAGLHPDVWLGSVDMLDGIRRAGPAADLRATPIGASPLVLAVPEALYARDPTVLAGDRPGKRTWPQLFELASRPAGSRLDDIDDVATGWGVVRPDPAVSYVGRLATMSLYQGITDAATAHQRVEEWIEQAQDAGGYPPGDESALLCRERAIAPGQRPAAVVATELAVVQYNLGRPLGPACGGSGAPEQGGRLVAFYPRDDTQVTQYALGIRWRDPAVQSDAVRRAAADFAAWIANDPSGRAALLAGGLRPTGYSSSDPSPLNDICESSASAVVAGAPCALADWPFSDTFDTRTDTTAALSVYAGAHRSATVQVMLDVSGSMRNEVGTGRTRYDVALSGVTASLGRMGGHDEFGLALFSTAVGGGGVQTVLPLQRRDPAVQDPALRRLDTFTPVGDTPLYRAMDSGIAAVRGSVRGPDALGALVVLTDGVDTSSGGVHPDTSAGSRVRVFVIAIGEASCDVPEIVRVTGETGGSCLPASATTVDQTLGALFSTLWEGNG